MNLYLIIYISCVFCMSIVQSYSFFWMAKNGRKPEKVSVWGVHLGLLFAPLTLPLVLFTSIKIRFDRQSFERRVQESLKKQKESGIDAELEKEMGRT